jgi:hypothetical protein
MSAEISVTAEKDVTGIRLYQPWVLFLLFVLGGIPLGLAFYGINVCRRDNRCMGILFISLGSLAYIGLLISAFLGAGGGTAGAMGLFLGIFIGIWVLKMEWEPYKRAIGNGAVPARWWPPLVLWLAAVIIFFTAYVMTM